MCTRTTDRARQQRMQVKLVVENKMNMHFTHVS